jgi:hypothetical protein
MGNNLAAVQRRHLRVDYFPILESRVVAGLKLLDGILSHKVEAVNLSIMVRF